LCRKLLVMTEMVAATTPAIESHDELTTSGSHPLQEMSEKLPFQRAIC
jgi:hypothetical protein